MVEEPQPLRAGYPYRLDAMERDLIDEARTRAEQAGPLFEPDAPTP